MPVMNDQPDYDPVFLHCRQEAIVILGVWVAAMIWTLSSCAATGYVDGQDVPTIFGMPSWVCWGIALPWLVADVVAIALCLFYIRDDDLGVAHEGADVAEDIRHRHEGEGDGNA